MLKCGRINMAFLRRRFKAISTSSGESAEDGSEETSLRRICKCPHFVLAELGHTVKLKASHPRFGPLYREDESEVIGKKDAWDKVLDKSGDEDETRERYLSAVRRIEKDARDAYGGDKALYNLTESEFRWMMIEDGCFFLQLALSVLGVSSKKLGYPENHLVFGKKQNNKDVKRWTEAMLFVGNQIPLVVLNELMKQKFFQNVLSADNETDWGDTPSDLFKRVLYKSLVLPALEYGNHQVVISTSPSPRKARVDQKHKPPCDLLHALHREILGSGALRTDLLPDETGDDDDLEAGSAQWEDEKDLTLSAAELARKGILIQKLERCGRIKFTDHIIFARLVLPTFTVNDETELLWKSLKYYEMTQHGKKGQCAVRSYLKFMSHLVRSYEDAKFLAKKGIIKAESLYHKEKLPTILSKLAGKDKITTQNHHLVRIQLRDYNQAPWERFKLVAILVFVLSFIQTFFAVLAYFKPPPQK